MKISSAGIALLKEFEGCKLTAYRDSAGVWSVGYGLTSAAGIIAVHDGLKITQAQADDYLVRALVQYETSVVKLLDKTPTQNQFDAMCSLCFNIGSDAMRRSSVVRYFNLGMIAKAADAFRLWDKGGGKVLPGLIRRREAERQLFLLPEATEKPVQPVPALPLPPDVPLPETPPVRPAVGFWRSLWLALWWA